MDAQWIDEFHHALRVSCRTEKKVIILTLMVLSILQNRITMRMCMMDSFQSTEKKSSE